MSAVIFDMDGVVLDSELHWKTTEGYFLRSLVPTWNSTDQDKIIGLGVQDLYTRLINEQDLSKADMIISNFKELDWQTLRRLLTALYEKRGE